MKALLRLAIAAAVVFLTHTTLQAVTPEDCDEGCSYAQGAAASACYSSCASQCAGYHIRINVYIPFDGLCRPSSTDSFVYIFGPT